MNIVNRWRARLAGAACALALINPVSADTLLNTGAPGGFFGYYGFDVFVGQSVAVGFTPTQDYTFTDVSLWLMSNDFDAPGRLINVSLQADAAGSATPAGPSGTVLESWAHATTAVGWTPVLETLTSTTHTVLHAGTTYWIVAESGESAGVDPIWVAAADGAVPYYMGNIDYLSSPAWQIGQSTGAPGAIVNASPVPEPAALMLSLAGVPLLVVAARRRARKPA